MIAYSLEEQSILEMEIRALLADLGTGKVDGVAYDTAWVARLAPRYPEYGFDNALEWLRHNQYEDGTWGAPLVQYHDRFISTLAAIVALREAGDGRRDERRVKRGEDALWKYVGQLGKDDSDTVGFPVLSSALSEEATQLGLDVPKASIRYSEKYKAKVDAFLQHSNRNWRSTTLVFSLEGLLSSLQSNDSVLEDNHSVCISPSATAAYLLKQNSLPALGYLQNVMDEAGAIPALEPIDIFEIAWGLTHIRMTGLIHPDDVHIRRALDLLWNIWSPIHGVSTATHFGTPDVDDTAAVFSILKWGGYPVDPDVFSSYELDNHFCCYHGETNPALSAHVRLLVALKQCEDHPRYEQWINKTVNTLRNMDDNGSFWWDKWHASPYYVNSTAVMALHNVDDDLAATRLKWIKRTQNDDGGWGYYGKSTPEETAYCLEALLFHHEFGSNVDMDMLDTAANYLRLNMTKTPYQPLWIGKSLYTPQIPVKAVILSALYRYHQLKT